MTLGDQDPKLIDSGLNGEPFFDSRRETHKEVLDELPLFFLIFATEGTVGDHLLSMLLIFHIKFREHLKGERNIIVKSVELVTLSVLKFEDNVEL